MRPDSNNTEKRIYNAPQVERIDIDKDVSLQLQSAPPIPGNEKLGGFLSSNTPEFLNSDPFKGNMA